jgi:hypothetical protein
LSASAENNDDAAVCLLGAFCKAHFGHPTHGDPSHSESNALSADHLQMYCQAKRILQNTLGNMHKPLQGYAERLIVSLPPSAP